MLSSEPAERY